jgi:hypothetical protein
MLGLRSTAMLDEVIGVAYAGDEAISSTC